MSKVINLKLHWQLHTVPHVDEFVFTIPWIFSKTDSSNIKINKEIKIRLYIRFFVQ